jgi:hypothetical protein
VMRRSLLSMEKYQAFFNGGTSDVAVA